MTIRPNGFESVQEVRVPTGQPTTPDLVVVTGIALLSFNGTGGDWRRDALEFEIGPKWVGTPQVAATAALASISNDQTAVNAGWAVDSVTHDGERDDKVYLRIGIAVRDSDGALNRVSFAATMLGQLETS